MKKIFTLVLATALLMTLVSCSSTTTDAPTDAPADTNSGSSAEGTSDEPVTVNVTFTSQEEQYRAAYDHFNSMQDEVFVNFEVVPDQQLGTILNETLGTPDAPDIVWGSVRTEMWAYAGLIEPLDSYVERDNYDMSGLFEFAVEQNRIDGQLYGIPRGSDTYAFALNKAIFEKYGVPVPEDGEWSWTDVEEISRELQAAIDAAGGHETALGLQLNDPVHVLVNAMVGNGSKVFTEDGTATALNSPESLEMLEMINNMVKDGVALDANSILEANVSALLGSNLIAICNMTSGTSSMETLELSEGIANVQFMPWPNGPTSGENNLVDIVINNYVMNSGSNVKDAAWEVLKYLGGEECDAILVERRTHFPGHITNADLWLETGMEGLNYQHFVDQSKDFNIITMPNNQLGYLGLLNTHMLPIWEGQITPQEGLANLETAVNEQIGGLVAS